MRATKAVILARVSTDEQEEGYSLDAQDYRLTEYCKNKKLEVVKIFKIVESSTVGDRKEFMEMVAFVKKFGEPIAVVADKIDRAQRNFDQFPLLDKLVRDGKVEFHFYADNCTIHKDSPANERFMWAISVALAQNYVDSLRDNVKRSIGQKLRGGEWISQAPVGYLHVKDARGKPDIVIDPLRAPLVRQLFEKYATDNYTLSMMVKEAKKMGLTNSRGNQGYISKGQMDKILKEPFYHGIMHVKKRNEYHAHRYETIITQSLFDECADVRSGRKRKAFRYRGLDFMFRGLLTCAASGRIVTAERHMRTYQNGNKSEWVYLASYNPDKLQQKIFVREEEVMAQVETALGKLHVQDKSVMQELSSYLERTHGSKKEFHKAQTADLKKEHTEIEHKLDKLMDLLIEGTIATEDFEPKKRSLKNRQYEIDKLLLAHDQTDDQFTNQLQALINLAHGSLDAFRGSDNAGKRDVLNFIFSNLQLRGKKLEYTMAFPFSKFAECTKIDEWCGRGDSNSQASRRYHLKVVRLPIPPRPPIWKDRGWV